MLNLTTQQRTELENGEPISCVMDQTACIVVRKDIFERIQHVAYDDSDLMPEEMLALAGFAFEDAENAGPIPTHAIASDEVPYLI